MKTLPITHIRVLNTRSSQIPFSKLLLWNTSRSSRPEVFCKKGIVRNLLRRTPLVAASVPLEIKTPNVTYFMNI